MKYKLVYCKDKGLVVADGLLQRFISEFTNEFFDSEFPYSPYISFNKLFNETQVIVADYRILDCFRVLIATNKLSGDDVKFYFTNDVSLTLPFVELFVDEDGRYRSNNDVYIIDEIYWYTTMVLVPLVNTQLQGEK